MPEPIPTDIESPADFVRALSSGYRGSLFGEWKLAASTWEQITAANPWDGTFWDFLGEARFRLGEYEQAIPAFERALTLGVGHRLDAWRFPSQIAYSIAQCHAKLGHRDEAARWLDQALDRGYRDIEAILQDEDLAPIAGAGPFSYFVSAEPSTREEKWVIDLEVFERELIRRAKLPFPRLDESALRSGVARLRENLSQLTDNQLLVELAKLTKLLNDGHSGIAPADEPPAPRLPLQLFLFDQTESGSEAAGLVVIAAAPKYRDLLGARIVSIDGVPAQDVVERLDAIATRDNEWQVKTAVPRLARSLRHLHGLGITKREDAATLELVPAGGGRRTVEVAGEGYKPAGRVQPGWVQWADVIESGPPLSLVNMASPFWFTFLPEQRVAYTQCNGVMDDPAEPLETFARRLADWLDDVKPEKLVVDVRWNGGGNTFKEMALINALIGSRLNSRGRLYVIIGRSTYSAAQNFVTMLWRHAEAIFVGEPTGSSPNFIGETCPFTLPHSKLSVNVSDLFWQSSWPMDSRTSLPPQIYAPPTYDSWATGRDPALEAVLSLNEHLPGL